MGAHEVQQFLTRLAVVGRVAASTQNQARSALLFLYREVLDVELPWLDDVEAAKTPKRLPVVLTSVEVMAVLSRLEGSHGLIARLPYGTGLRIMECLRLRVKDVVLERGEILVRDGKGFKDRVTMLPASVAPALREHLERVRERHRQDLAAGHGEVYLPYALDRKYPAAGREWLWQYVFPSASLSVDPRSGVVRRRHVQDQSVQRAVRRAARAAGIDRPATPQVPRHSFATRRWSARNRGRDSPLAERQRWQDRGHVFWCLLPGCMQRGRQPHGFLPDSVHRQQPLPRVPHHSSAPRP